MLLAEGSAPRDAPQSMLERGVRRVVHGGQDLVGLGAHDSNAELASQEALIGGHHGGVGPVQAGQAAIGLAHRQRLDKRHRTRPQLRLRAHREGHENEVGRALSRRVRAVLLLLGLKDAVQRLGERVSARDIRVARAVDAGDVHHEPVRHQPGNQVHAPIRMTANAWPVAPQNRACFPLLVVAVDSLTTWP